MHITANTDNFGMPCSFVNLTLLLEIMHCVCNLWIIHLFASKLVTTVCNKIHYYAHDMKYEMIIWIWNDYNQLNATFLAVYR